MTREATTNTALELSLLQLLRLKGRATPDDLTASLRAPDAGRAVIEAAEGAGHCVAKGAGIRLTPEGKQRLASLAAAEREHVDQDRLQQLYTEFDTHNTALKAVVTAWQMRVDGTPNDHTDMNYDSDVLARLFTVHDDFTPLLGRIVETAPRLAHYPLRFATAVDRIRTGDHTYVARPIIDSYHTVWFELHEELICLLGRSRQDEAAAGRAS